MAGSPESDIVTLVYSMLFLRVGHYACKYGHPLPAVYCDLEHLRKLKFALAASQAVEDLFRLKVQYFNTKLKSVLNRSWNAKTMVRTTELLRLVSRTLAIVNCDTNNLGQEAHEDIFVVA